MSSEISRLAQELVKVRSPKKPSSKHAKALHSSVWSDLEEELAALAKKLHKKGDYSKPLFSGATQPLEAKFVRLLEDMFDNDSILDLQNNQNIYSPAIEIVYSLRNNKAIVTPLLCERLLRVQSEYHSFQQLSKYSLKEKWPLESGFSKLWTWLNEQAVPPAALDGNATPAQNSEEKGVKTSSGNSDPRHNRKESSKPTPNVTTRSSAKQAETLLVASPTTKKQKDKHSKTSKNAPSQAASDKSAATIAGSMDVDAVPQTPNADDLSASYVAALKPHQVGEMSLESTHSFRADTTVPPAATILRLAQELSVLSNSLPLNSNSSIFLRWDSNRINLLRAMITGPKDTPYHHGCFVFDILVPSTYPTFPPKVRLLTTGNGTVRFNPNLYQNGTVCLSLLGTWSGSPSEMWIPAKSTLLQLLVSIQSLIMCPDPYFNEPGFEAYRENPQYQAHSADSNKELTRHTRKHAILHYISYQPTTDFDHIARLHFSHTKPPNLDAVDSNTFDWMKGIAKAS